jgi:hypothetical protein
MRSKESPLFAYMSETQMMASLLWSSTPRKVGAFRA